VRRKSGGPDADRRQDMARLEVQEDSRITANKRQRKLDDRHPKNDAESRLGHRQLFGGNHCDCVAKRCQQHEYCGGIKVGQSWPENHKHANQPKNNNPEAARSHALV
jgi:hypothetical protein